MVELAVTLQSRQPSEVIAAVLVTGCCSRGRNQVADVATTQAHKAEAANSQRIVIGHGGDFRKAHLAQRVGRNAVGSLGGTGSANQHGHKR